MGSHIIGTTGDLAPVVNGMDPATPVVMNEPTVELGADPNRDDGWAIIAETTVLPATADGQIATRDDPAVIVNYLSPEGVSRRLAGVHVLQLSLRQLLVPGVVGPEALPADPRSRRRDALDTYDGDMSRWLLELRAEFETLAEEVQAALDAEHQPFSPGTVRHLRRAIEALREGKQGADAALAFADTCNLARLAYVDNGQPCDTGRVHDVMVYLPDPHLAGGSQESGCRSHATLAVNTILGAELRCDEDGAGNGHPSRW
ncbi:hypothetical protein [Nonomuraea sp. KM90]|uniref:hypothetical protein n=1 Tax=Nonomuraea sp. KM90 TaxID=3457428 RepID=UPI003FCDFB18